ncbi:unnamed protein product [Effrenium voratum]|uniref:Uncharacterized protein n=1 Tax=Effrenium voratum TaxID=2562239 RepID=A0AA36NMB1_9DINO|nr:unnamed protein product [Effrenium voratum]
MGLPRAMAMSSRATLFALLSTVLVQYSSAATADLLTSVKTEVASVKTSVASFATSVDSAKTIAEYPGQINTARQCMATLFPVLTTGLTTIAAVPFPALQTGANAAKTVVTAGKSTFETATSAIPTIASSSTQVANQMATVKGTADGLTNGLDAFNLIVDRGLKMLEQVGLLLHFGAALDAVKAKLQSLFESLTSEFPEQVTAKVVSAMAGWTGATQLQTQLDMIALTADVDSKAFDTAPLIATLTTSSRTAIDAALAGLLDVSALVANATSMVEAEVKKSLRDIARLFSQLAQGLTANQTATAMMDDLLLRPLDEAVTEMMSSMEKEYLAWLDFSDAQKTSLQSAHEGVDVAAVFTAVQTALSSKASALATTIYPTVIDLIKTSVASMGQTVTNELLSDCAPPKNPIACVKEKVEAAMSSAMATFKASVITKMQEHGSSIMSEVITEAQAATSVTQAKIEAMLMSMASIPNTGQDLAAALQAQMKVKVEAALARSQARADELMEALPMPPGLAAVAGLVANAPNWKTGLLAVFEAVVGNGIMKSLEVAISTVVNTAVTTIKATSLTELKASLTSYLTDSLGLSASVAASKATELETSALGFWNLMRLDERVIELSLILKDYVLKWALAKKSELSAVMDSASSFDVESVLGGAAGSINSLKEGIKTAGQPLADATSTLSSAVDGLSQWKTSAESVLTALNSACTPANQFKDALKSITDWLDAEYCLNTVLSSLGCIGGYDVGIVTLPRICAKDYISKSAYCMVPSQLLQMEVCVKVPDPCSCLETALGSSAMNICLGASTISDLVATAFNSVISAAGVGNWDLGINFEIPTLPELNFPDIDSVVNLNLQMPNFEMPKLLVTSDGTITLQGWMDQGYNIFTQTVATAVGRVLELLKSAVVLDNVADAANMITNAEFKAALEEGFAKQIGVNASQVSVALSLVNTARRLQSGAGSVQADYTVEVAADSYDGESSDEVQYKMEKVSYDKTGFLTEAKTALQSRSLTSLQSSTVGSVSVATEPEEQVAAQNLQSGEAPSGAWAAWSPLYLLFFRALL